MYVGGQQLAVITAYNLAKPEHVKKPIATTITTKLL